MDSSVKNKAHQYGFYDPFTKQFYAIPARSEEEFKNFLAMLGVAVNQTPTHRS